MNIQKYFKKAREEYWAIGQFNFSTLEQFKGIISASRELNSPVILGTSEGESSYIGLDEAVALVRVFVKKNKLPVFLNLDHAKSFEYVKKAIDAGYPMVHFDGSALSFEDNVRLAKEIAKYGHSKGVFVEGELGRIKGESSFHQGDAAVEQSELTLPEQVAEFVKKTKVDSLAVAIGNIHGMYAGSQKELDFERLEKIGSLSRAFLVLHGASGITDARIKKAISLGIVKININTELRMAWRKSLEKCLSENKEEFKPYKILPEVEDSIKAKVMEKINIFGSAGKK